MIHISKGGNPIWTLFLRSFFSAIILSLLVAPLICLADDPEEEELKDNYASSGDQYAACHDAVSYGVCFTPDESYQILNFGGYLKRLTDSQDLTFYQKIYSCNATDAPETSLGTTVLDFADLSSSTYEWTYGDLSTVVWVTANETYAVEWNFPSGNNPNIMFAVWRDNDVVASYPTKYSSDNWVTSSNASYTLWFRIYGSTTPHYYENDQWNIATWDDAIEKWRYCVVGDNETTCYYWDDEDHEWDESFTYENADYTDPFTLIGEWFDDMNLSDAGKALFIFGFMVASTIFFMWDRYLRIIMPGMVFIIGIVTGWLNIWVTVPIAILIGLIIFKFVRR